MVLTEMPSVALITMSCRPVCAAVGVQLKAPVDVSRVAPCGMLMAW
jgi:hypothetical protein